jgi:ankyrin repeat protein
MSHRTIIGACVTACFLAALSSYAQNTPDPSAGLRQPIKQLQADPLRRLYAAVVTHDHKSLQALLDGGDSANGFGGWNPVVMACQLQDLDAVKILVEGGADVNLFDFGGENALLKAVDVGPIEIVRYLLAHGANVHTANPNNGETALFTPVRWHQFEILTMLIQAGADVNHRNRDGNTPLVIAEFANDSEMVKFLKANGAKLDSPNEEIFFAASDGDVVALQRMITVGVKARSHTWSYRFSFKHQRAVKRLEWSTSIVNQPYGGGNTPLMAAAQNGQTAAVKVLIAAGANLNSIDSGHDTALMLAIKSAHISTIFALLDAGADPTIVDLGGGSTLLEASLYIDDPDLVRFLIRRGVPTDRVGPGLTCTPLMIAAQFDRVQTVKVLLDAHVSINEQFPDDGSTALMDAAHHPDVLTLLLRAGADPTIKDKEGKTALDWAIKMHVQAAIDMLRNPPPVASSQ